MGQASTASRHARYRRGSTPIARARQCCAQGEETPLPLSGICVAALRRRLLGQRAEAEHAGEAWHDSDQIFTID